MLNKFLPKSTEEVVNTSKFGRLLCRTEVRCSGNRSLPLRICETVRIAVSKALVLWISAELHILISDSSNRSVN
jgi:hypothetical protein